MLHWLGKFLGRLEGTLLVRKAKKPDIGCLTTVAHRCIEGVQGIRDSEDENEHHKQSTDITYKIT
jgi:hypothetical protein